MLPLETAFLLLVFYYVLVLAEFFVPSGGLLTLSAVIAGLGSIGVAATHSLRAAFSVTVIIAVTTPMMFTLLVRLWPRTPMGKWLLIRQSDRVGGNRTSRTAIGGTPLTDYVGSVGTAETDLLPGGKVRFGDETVDGVTDAVAIDRGRPVRVIGVRHRRLVVEPSSDSSDANETPRVEPVDEPQEIGSSPRQHREKAPEESGILPDAGQSPPDAGDEDRFDLSRFQ